MSELLADDAEIPKKKSKLIPILLVAVVLLGGGSGGGFYFWKIKGSNKPQEHVATKKNSEDGDDEADVKEVIELQPFIVNLADPNEARYLRMTISLGVGESTEEKVDPLYTTKIRNAILAAVTNKTSAEILTVEGKATLRKELLVAARKAAHKPEVHAIYITDFIVQM
ncbi:MAG TPA: flagellar basal body-associated FliL family protein [Pyrinomonadaceae bacterium]|nr:flagellar basal body-associated FliL family protein [Pyrinomonadaceae bacterium]